MHSIRRFSLRSLHDLVVLPRRLSKAILGPVAEKGLPRSANSAGSPSSSGSSLGKPSKRRTSSRPDRLSLPRQLSLALLAPMFGTGRSDDDGNEHDDDLGLDGEDGYSTSPHHQRGSSRSALLDGPRIQRHEQQSIPSLFNENDLFRLSSPSGPEPTPGEKVDPLEQIVLLALAPAAVFRGELLGRSPASATAPAVTGHLSRAASEAIPGIWLPWRRPSAPSNPIWLSWASSLSSGESEAKETAEGHDPFVERSLYRRFSAPAFLDMRTAPGRSGVLPVEILNDRCLESWVGQGVPCSRDLVQSDQPPRMGLDVVFTWVNGSDPRWEDQRAEYLQKTEVSPGPPSARHYRSDKDELRHSLRSVMSKVKPSPSRVHLVLGDWEDQSKSAIPGGRRGQIPGWLAWNEGRNRSSAPADDAAQTGRLEALTDGAGSATVIHVHHHSEIFRTPTSTTADEHAAFVRASLPTFNSFAIESMLHNIDVGADLATTIVYLNDDFFLLQPHTKADFSSPLLGVNLRLGDPWAYTIPYWQDPAVGCDHEWSSLLRSNWLLSRRFGHRARLPLQHVAKTLSRPLLAEMHALWPTEFASAAQRRFREQSSGKYGDLNPSWLSSYLLIERAREAMLWTWAVARLGGTDGRWGVDEREEIKSLLKLTPDAGSHAVASSEPSQSATAQVRSGKRKTLDRSITDDGFAGLGIEGQMSTYPTWSSLDGYLAPLVDNKCEISLDHCFDGWWSGQEQTVDASEMFARLAFGEATKCGDCLLAAIVGKSGPAGLSALLPDNGSSFSFPTDVAESLPQAGVPQDQQPHMPLTADFLTTSFSLADVLAAINPSDPLRPIDLRTYSLQLIARYQYVNSGTNALFKMLSSPTEFGELVERLTTDPSVVSLALNDDIEEQWVPVLEPIIKAYLGIKFAVRGWWERDGI